MNRFELIFTLLIVFNITAKCQILIGDIEGNTIYSSVVNRIQYIGNHDCEGLSVKIEGYDDEINFQNCTFEITYIKFDTSRLEIYNQFGKIIFDTILIKNENEAKGYVQVDGKSLIGGSIKESELQFLEKVRVKYECPWTREPIIYGFNLIIVNDKGGYLSYEISGSEISNSIKKEIMLMDNPKKIYIEQISWKPISCFEGMNSIVLEIE